MDERGQPLEADCGAKVDVLVSVPLSCASYATMQMDGFGSMDLGLSGDGGFSLGHQVTVHRIGDLSNPKCKPCVGALGLMSFRSLFRVSPS